MNDLSKAKILCLKYKLKENMEYKDDGIDYLDEVISYIKSGFNNLKAIDTIETRSQMEYDIYNKTEYPGGLWLCKQNYIYQIYATIIGVLDAKYDDYSRMLKREEENIFKNEKEIKMCEENIKKILKDRNKIVKDYYEIVSYDGLNIVGEIIKEIPTHKEFIKLSNSMRKQYYSGNLQGEFMVSYLLGYNKSLFFDENKLINAYDELLNEYKKTSLEKEYHSKLVKKLVFKKEN